MTDYLELLLEQQEGEKEEDTEAPALGTEGEDFPRRGGRQEKSPPDTAAADAGFAPGGSAEPPPPAAFALGQGALPRPAGPASGQSGEAWISERRKTAGNLPEQALGRMTDALTPDSGDGAGRMAALPGESGGAAGLARRLAGAALAAAAPARTVFAAGTEDASPTGDWEEFDRRLERDARRYDGGVGLY